MPIEYPSALELLEAAEEFLRKDVLDKLEGAQRYHLQVALNALAIVARELALGARLEAEESARLAELVGPTGPACEANQVLCAKIRARELTWRDAKLMRHLFATALGKMSIDNPRYATYLRATSPK